MVDDLSEVPDREARHTFGGLGSRLAWMVLAGSGFGAATSLLNHSPALGSVASVVGSGAGWGVLGVAAAMIIGVRHPGGGWLGRVAAVAGFYLGACLTYYVSDWIISIPGTLRLREDVRAGRIPDPGIPDGLDLVPDLREWVVWSALSIPAALLVTGIAQLLLPFVRPRRTPPSAHR